MSDANAQTPPGWYYAAGDPPGTQRYWDGTQWQGGPQPVAAGGPGAMAAGPSLADPGKRIVARILDFIVWIIITTIVTAVFGGASVTDGGFNVDTSAASILAGIISVILVTAYETYMLMSRGQTLGKMVLNIRVETVDGSPFELVTGIKRMAFYLVGVIPGLGGLVQFFAGLAGLVMIFTDGQKQAPWDKVAGTIVVDA